MGIGVAVRSHLQISPNIARGRTNGNLNNLDEAFLDFVLDMGPPRKEYSRVS